MTGPRWFATGDLASLSRSTLQSLMNRGGGENDSVVRATSAIVSNVRTRGDSALREMALQFDGARLDALDVPTMFPFRICVAFRAAATDCDSARCCCAAAPSPPTS
jgi:histidinol dehydrogenase